MSGILLRTLALSAALVFAPIASAVTPAQEKAFVDAYRKAFEAKDPKGLQALLYTQGADPKALEFYRMMVTADSGARIVSLQLAELNAQDRERLAKSDSPDGRPMRLVLPAVRKLVVKTERKDANGSSTGTSTVFVGEHGGKLWIPVPGVAK